MNKSVNASLDQKTIGTYRKRARNYDITANLYYLLGDREWAYHRKAVDALRLEPGDTVVELACGTGLIFPLIQQGAGPGGQEIERLNRAKICGWTSDFSVNCIPSKIFWTRCLAESSQES